MSCEDPLIAPPSSGDRLLSCPAKVGVASVSDTLNERGGSGEEVKNDPLAYTCKIIINYMYNNEQLHVVIRLGII